jgi:hypothetical protein
LFSVCAAAEDDPPSLGVLARYLSNNKSEQSKSMPQPGPSGSVIDNDNLTQVMDDAKNARPIKQDKTVFSIDTASNTLKVS